MARRANTTSFKPGQSGNPKGRAPGAKDLQPRGVIRRIVVGAVEKNEEAAITAFTKLLKDPRHVAQALELAGKLNKEIGHDAQSAVRPVTVNFYTALRPGALAGPHSPMRALAGKAAEDQVRPAADRRGGRGRRRSQRPAQTTV